MSKIDEYHKIKEENENLIERLRWSIGVFPENSEYKFDPNKSKIVFSAPSDEIIGLILCEAEYGYQEENEKFLALTHHATEKLAEAITMYIPEIIPATQKLLQAEIDKARDEARQEVKEILGDLQCDDDYNCKIDSE